MAARQSLSLHLQQVLQSHITNIADYGLLQKPLNPTPPEQMKNTGKMNDFQSQGYQFFLCPCLRATLAAMTNGSHRGPKGGA